MVCQMLFWWTKNSSSMIKSSDFTRNALSIGWDTADKNQKSGGHIYLSRRIHLAQHGNIYYRWSFTQVQLWSWTCAKGHLHDGPPVRWDQLLYSSGWSLCLTYYTMSDKLTFISLASFSPLLFICSWFLFFSRPIAFGTAGQLKDK